MILTDDEINKISGGSVDYFDRIVFARAIESALLEKLRGGVELPAPTARFNWNLGKFEWLVTFKHSEHHLKPLYSHDQLLAYGAAQRLAASERGTCTWTEQDDKDMPCTYESSCGEMWSFTDGGIKENRVTYCHHCGGKVVPASPQEQT